MNWMDYLWPMLSGSCVTLALLSVWIACGVGRRAPYLFFASAAVAVAVIGWFELSLMRTDDLPRYEFLLRWAVVPIFVMVASVGGFVWSFFGAGRKGLLLTAIGLNGISQVVNLLSPAPAVRHAVALHHVELWGGGHFTVPTIVNSPWNIVELASVLLLVLFIFDASVQVWRRGERRSALVVGGGTMLFFLVARLHAVMVEEGILQTPYFVSFAFVGVLVAMGHELSSEVFRAARLSKILSESEQRMRLVAESANLGMWAWDRDEVWMTDTARVLFGFGRDQRLRYEDFNTRVHPEDLAARNEAIERAMAARGVYSLEYRVNLPDGTQRWLASRGQCLEGKAGEGGRLQGVVTDITAQRTAELQLRRQREEIAHLNRVSTVGQLASALAHELSQPLGAILRNTEAAEIYLESESPDLKELREIVVDIRKDDQRAGEVIHRLRTLLKRREIEPVPLPVLSLLQEVIRLVRPDASARHVTLELEGSEDLPEIKGDRVHLQQVLLNLILNAMDAMADSGAGPRVVTLGASRSGMDRVEISVSDTGKGLGPGQAERVFDPFFTTKAEGMGMGLAISKTIVDAHGGRIWAENNAGRGATFRFTLAAVEIRDCEIIHGS